MSKANLIDPKQSRFGYWFVYGAGVLQLFGTGALLVYGAGAVEYLLAVVLVLSAALFLAVARVIGAAKGEVHLDESRQEVVVTGRDEDDTLAFALKDLTGIVVRRRQEDWGDAIFVSSTEFSTRQGVYVGLLEFSSLEQAQEAGLYIRQVVKLPLVQADQVPAMAPELTRAAPPAGISVAAAQGRVTLEFSTGIRWGLSLPISVLALFCLVSGGILLAGLEVTGIVGVLFGPVAVALGLCLGVLWAFKGLGFERLVLEPGRLLHSFHLASFSWGRKELPLDDAGLVARIATKGAQGFRLELLSGGKMVVLGSGSTTGSKLSPRGLVQLGSYIWSVTAKDADPAASATPRRPGE